MKIGFCSADYLHRLGKGACGIFRPRLWPITRIPRLHGPLREQIQIDHQELHPYIGRQESRKEVQVMTPWEIDTMEHEESLY